MFRVGEDDGVWRGQISFAAAVGEFAVHLAVGLAFDEVLPAVAVGFAQSQADEDLEAAVFEIALEGDEGAGAAFFDLAHEAHDFGVVEEEFAGAVGLRVGPVAVAVGGDVEGVEPGLAVFDPAVGVGEVASAGADGFDFGPGEDDAGLDRLGDGIVVTGLAVMDFDGFQGT